MAKYKSHAENKTENKNENRSETMKEDRGDKLKSENKMEKGEVNDVSSTLYGVSFPADKSTIITYAEDQNASDNLIGILRGLPDRTFNNVDEVKASLAQE